MRHLAAIVIIMNFVPGVLWAQVPSAPEWSQEFKIGGVPGLSTVKPITNFLAADLGDGPRLFLVGRDFSETDWSGSNSNVMQWDGREFTQFGAPLVGGAAQDAVVFDDGTGPALYVGLDFSAATRGLVKWDGAAWTIVGGGIASGRVWDLEVFDDGTGPALYVGGNFTMPGVASHLVKWDGTSFSPVGGGVNAEVTTFTVFDDGTGAALYLGGSFTMAGATPVALVAKWDGTTFNALGMNLSGGAVSVLSVEDLGNGPRLFAGGTFVLNLGPSICRGIASWDGTIWSGYGVGIANVAFPVRFVYAIETYDDGSGPALYVGGNFEVIGGLPADSIAKWDGSAWSDVDGSAASIGPIGVSTAVNTLLTYDDGHGPRLFAGGIFTGMGKAAASCIAAWNGQSWSQVSGNGANDVIYSVKSGQWGGENVVLATGLFTVIGGAAANRIAIFNGKNWSALGSGITGPVFDAAIFDDGSGPAIYAVGIFATAGGQPASSIAKWNGTSWSALGSGINGFVYSAVVHDDGSGPALYVGGNFSMAGGIFVPGLARWNGSTWSGVGPATTSAAPGDVRDLVSLSLNGGPTRLYAAGFLGTASFSAQNVAFWNGSSWTGIGVLTGLAAWGRALTKHDDGTGEALYLGGSFTAVNGVPAPSLARWNGAVWNGIGTGPTRDPANNFGNWVPYVSDLASFDDGQGPQLYIAGLFDGLSGVPAHNLGRWNGTTFSNVGGSMTESTYANPNIVVEKLTVLEDGCDTSLVVGGGFQRMGGITSRRIARWGKRPSTVSTLPGLSALAEGHVADLLGAPEPIVGIDFCSGGAEHRIEREVNAPFTLTVQTPSPNGFPSAIALYAFTGIPTAADQVVLPFGLGTTVFPFCPLAPGDSRVVAIADGFGFGGCTALTGIPATPVAISAPSGIPFPIDLVFQGIVIDVSATFSISLTNAVQLSIY